MHITNNSKNEFIFAFYTGLIQNLVTLKVNISEINRDSILLILDDLFPNIDV